MEVLSQCLRELGIFKAGIYSQKEYDENICEPCTIVLNEDGLCARVYDEIYEKIKDICEKEDVFSDESIEKLYNICNSYAKEKGFVISKHTDIIDCYEIKSVLGKSEKAKKLSGNERDALFSDIAYLVTKGPLYGIAEKGEVVSLCGGIIKDAVAELYVETAPCYRGRGYATDCLYGVSKELLENYKVMYQCKRTNKASCNVVKKAGGEKICSYIRYIGRK